MSSKMEEIKDGAEDRKAVRRAWKDIAWLAVGLAVVGHFWYHIAEAPVDKTKFLGKEIIYENTYYTFTPGISLSNGQAVFSPDCKKVETHLVVTEDTLVISNSEGTRGFKPLYTTEDLATLVCDAGDSVEVGFTRKVKDTDPQTKENEILIYEEPNGAFIVFTAKKECFAVEKRSTDKMSDTHDTMTEDSAKVSVLPKRR